MHPDYIGYRPKTFVRPRATLFDIKYMCRKFLGIALDDMFVTAATWDLDYGWIVAFKVDVDIEELKANVYGVLTLSDRVVYINEIP